MHHQRPGGDPGPPPCGIRSPPCPSPPRASPTSESKRSTRTKATARSTSAGARWTAIIIAVLAAILAIADLGAHRATKTIITTESAIAANLTRYAALGNHRTTLENDAVLLDALGARERSPAAVQAREAAKSAAAKSAAATDAAQLAAQSATSQRSGASWRRRSSTPTAATPTWRSGSARCRFAIVLASVSIVAAANWLLGAGVTAGALGLLFTVFAIAST